MTPQELKNSILQLAIQGKLVEQRPEDGTGEELFQQIQAEKQHFIKAGKIKKEKPLPEITEEEKPFEIPESWIWVRLGTIINLLSGTDFKPDDYNNSGHGIPYITGASSLSSDGVLVNRWTEVPRVLAMKGDVLLVCKGSGYGKTVICDIEIAHIARQIMALRAFVGLNMDYLRFFLMACITEIKSNGQGVIPGIDRSSVLNLIFPLPPLAEQNRIVAKIKELQPYIERYEQAWSRLEAFNKQFPDDMRKSILQLAIQGKLVEQRPEEGTGEELYQEIQAEKLRLIRAGKIKKEKPLPEIAEEEKPFDIPESWRWVRWGDLSNSIQYGYNAPAKDSGRIKMVRISDIQEGNVQWDAVPYCEIEETDVPGYLLSTGDILFARTGGTVGKSYLVKDVPVEAVYAGYLIRTQYSKSLFPQYMKYYMDSQLYWNQLRNGTIATAQPNCNGKTLAKMMLPLPPLAEQKRIVAKLEELLPLCDKLK